MEELEKLGGVRFMFLTHRDDVADHRVFHEAFGCRRRRSLAVAADLVVVPTPGHTPGSAVLLHRDMRGR